MINGNRIKLVTIAGLLLLILAGSGIASAFSVTAHADEKQIGMIKELYGTKLTYGEYWGKVFPDQLAEMKKNIPENEYAEFSGTVVYWGDDHPELPYGATVWDENGPLNLREISSGEKREFGLEDLKTDESGYVVRGLDPLATASTLNKLSALVSHRTKMAPMAAMILSAYDLSRSGSSIIHGGTGMVGGGSYSTTLLLRTELYGDGGMVDYYQQYWGSGGMSQHSISDQYPYPRNGVYYQSKLIGQSTNPTTSGYTWSYGRLWPF